MPILKINSLAPSHVSNCESWANAFVTLALLTSSLRNALLLPALNASIGNDVSMSYVLVVKNQSLDFGNGGGFNSTHYVTQRGDECGSRSNAGESLGIRECAVRISPTYRFNVGANFEPFVLILAGYSRRNASNYFGPNNDGIRGSASSVARCSPALELMFRPEKGHCSPGFLPTLLTIEGCKHAGCAGNDGFAYHLGIADVGEIQLRSLCMMAGLAPAMLYPGKPSSSW